MTVTLVCNCGLRIESCGSTLYVDAPNAEQPPFYRMPQPPVIDEKTFFAFTHQHPDHYDAEFLKNVPSSQIFTPEFQPDCPFSVEFFPLVHTPLPADLMTEHFVLLVSDGEKTLYVTADAAPDVQVHEAILAGRTADAAFWNGQYLSHPETRALLRSCAKQSFVYHIPIDEADCTGIRRKCFKNMQRYGNELPNTALLTEYPTEIPVV